MAATGALHQEMGEAAADVPTQRAFVRKCAATLAKTEHVHKVESRDALRNELSVLQKLQYLTLGASVHDDVSCDQRKRKKAHNASTTPTLSNNTRLFRASGASFLPMCLTTQPTCDGRSENSRDFPQLLTAGVPCEATAFFSAVWLELATTQNETLVRSSMHLHWAWSHVVNVDAQALVNASAQRASTA